MGSKEKRSMKVAFILFILTSFLTSAVISTESVCTTESGPTPGLPCIFPFKVDGFAYHTCKLDEKDGSRWCSTKIDESGQHLQGNWGNCRSDCEPVHTTTTTKATTTTTTKTATTTTATAETTTNTTPTS